MRIPPAQTKGATLPELLIVITLIAILATLFVASTVSFQKRALGAKCISNLRQTGMALLSYANEHQGRIPPAIEPNPDIPGEYLSNTYWHQILRDGGYFGVVNPKLDKASRQKVGVHFCPEIPSTGTSDEAYGMRLWKPSGNAAGASLVLSTLPHPSDFFLMTDSYRTSTKKQFYKLGSRGTTQTIRFSHEGKANTLFADGHVAPMDRDYFDEIAVRQAEFNQLKDFAYWPE